MIQYLKCIGGPCDGRKVALQDGRREYVVREHTRLAMPRFLPLGATVEDFTSYHEHIYVVERVHVSEHEWIEFLRPREWSSAQTLRHALGD